MKSRLLRLKVIFFWMFSVLFMVAHPVEAQESLREIEETEEVKLYLENEEHSKRKPKKPTKNSSIKSLEGIEILPISHEFIFEKYPRYILYSSLVYYH